MQPMPLERYLTWIRQDALPLWLDRGFDRDRHLFHERLHLDGRPDISATLRSCAQARQIYVYARAADLSLSPRDQSLAAAIMAADRLHALAWAPDGKPGWVHLLSPDGSVSNGKRDLYDHAFMLLAFTHLAKISGEARFATWVEETLDYIDRHLTSPQTGWIENDRHDLPRRQNSHMHLLEASLALYETTGDRRHLTRADAIVSLFHRHFFDRRSKVLREYFGPDWQPHERHRSDRIEAGHQMEWCWLLRRHALHRDLDVDLACEQLFATALALGQGDNSGFLCDETSDAGEVLIPSRRLWPQTEYLRTLLSEANALSRPDLMQQARDLADRLLLTYLTETSRGTWRDQFDLKGAAIATHIPASTLYHLVGVAVEVQQLQEKL